jgi:type 1 glutamine amidotransferase
MLLVFSKTTGFRHASIADGIRAIRTLASEHTIGADFSEDSSIFTSENLARYQAVIFLNTSGNILNDDQKAAFEEYIHSGGGFVGVHAASDTEVQWSWYNQLLGAHFKNHPQTAQATINVEDQHHLSTSMLPAKWVRTDEWYNFASNPRPQVHVLLTLDETTYAGGTMGSDHPIAWYHNFAGGRAWYTALGHTSESFAEPLFLQHLWGGIVYAASLEETR